MGGIDCCADEQVQLCALFDQELCQAGGAVFRVQLIEKFGVELVADLFLQTLQAFAEGHIALCDEVNAVDRCHRPPIGAAGRCLRHDLFS